MMRLKECRENARMSQKFVALSLGLSSPSVSNWESGKTKPTHENIAKLADLYGVSVDYLVGRIDTPFPASESPAIGELSEDEVTLLLRYRSLNDEDKELLRSDALRMKRESDRGEGFASVQTAG